MITIFPINQIPEDILKHYKESKTYENKLLYAISMLRIEEPLSQLLLNKEFSTSSSERGIVVFKEKHEEYYIYFVCALLQKTKRFSPQADHVIKLLQR